jgi:hypothetical protein
MNAPDPTYQEKRDNVGDYNHRQEFEHTLIDRRTTWLLLTQTLVFADYGVTFDGKGDGLDEFRNVFAVLGISVVVTVL